MAIANLSLHGQLSAKSVISMQKDEKNATIKFGLIGESEGNGHPFSWTAIVNGYWHDRMRFCGYSSISAYLAQQRWDEPHIPNASISHIWTQDINRTRFIANTCKDVSPVTSISQIMSQVDAFIIARDDYIHNFKFAKELAAEGKPILFDKQIAQTSAAALEIIRYCRESICPIFTGSALAHDPNLPLVRWLKDSSVHTLEAKTPKKWRNYGVHIVDPIITSLEICNLMSFKSIEVLESTEIITCVHILVDRPSMPPLVIRLVSDNNYEGGFSFCAHDKSGIKKLTYIVNDPFNAFKSYLQNYTNFCALLVDPGNRERANDKQESCINHYLMVQSVIDKAALSS